MLSRLAERFYWLGRYVERAEDTARLLATHDQLLLDMPATASVLWRSLVEILGVDSMFRAAYRGYTERNVVRFAVTEEQSPSSIVSAIKFARENARTVREILPSEAWELVNQLYLASHDRAAQALNRTQRQDYLDSVVKGCQQLSGLFANTLSRREPYQFLALGAAIERADMTSRILDVGALYASGRGDAELAAYETVLWTNHLLSISAYQMYRQEVRARITAQGVVGFLLHDTAFPRAVAYCMTVASAALKELPQHAVPLAASDAVFALLAMNRRAPQCDGTLHDYLDVLQAKLGNFHTAVEHTWFA